MSKAQVTKQKDVLASIFMESFRSMEKLSDQESGEVLILTLAEIIKTISRAGTLDRVLNVIKNKVIIKFKEEEEEEEYEEHVDGEPCGCKECREGSERFYQR